MHWRGSTLCAAAMTALLALPRLGSAAPPAQPASEEEADKERQEADDRYRRGRALYTSAEWDKALAEFLASQKLRASSKATSGAAFSLGQLKRYDEALEMFEALL